MDIRDRSNTAGGYFVGQPGTAFGRVLGQGFEPKEVDDKDVFVDWSEDTTLTNLWSQVTPEMLEELSRIIIRSDGTIECYRPDSDVALILTSLTCD